jgi:hypothetical protein
MDLMGCARIPTSPRPPHLPCGSDSNFQTSTIDSRHQLIISKSAQAQERKWGSSDLFIWPDDNALSQIETERRHILTVLQSPFQIRIQPNIGFTCGQSLVVQARSTQRSQEFRLDASPADEMASANNEIVIGADIEDRGENWRSGIPLAETYRCHAYPNDDLIRLNGDNFLADRESGVLLRIRKAIEDLHDSRLVLIKLTAIRGFDFFGFRHMVTDNAHIPFFRPDAAALDL